MTNCSWSTCFLISVCSPKLWSCSIRGVFFGGGGNLLPPCSGLSGYGWHRRILTEEQLTGNRGKLRVVSMILV